MEKGREKIILTAVSGEVLLFDVRKKNHTFVVR
jgi:hypothetical protein